MKLVEELIKEAGLENVKDRLLLIGLGEALKSGVFEIKAVSSISTLPEEVKISIISKKHETKEIASYPGFRSKNWIDLRADINGFVTEIAIFKESFQSEFGKKKGWDPHWMDNMWLVSGKTKNKQWKSKNLYFQTGKDELLVRAWGATPDNPKRHKFSKEEAERIAQKYNLRLVWDNKKNKGSYVISRNEKEIARIWAILWNQI